MTPSQPQSDPSVRAAATPLPKVVRLRFVYNADAGWMNAAKDSWLKFLGQSTCALCTITHGLAGERQAWRDCRDDLDIPVVGVHRDEIDPALARTLDAHDLPVVVAVLDDSSQRVLLEKPALDACVNDPACLRQAIEDAAAAGQLRLG
ncbi:MAG: hypothetical protein AAF772_07745 [Acidobacteriota bacterium]